MKQLLYILLLIALPAMAQERQTLLGKVMVDDTAVAEVFVINKQTGTEVKTDAQGGFSIAAKPGDRLVVYSNKVNVREFVLGQASFVNMPYVLSVEIKAEQIEEVVVNRQTVTSESLGLVPENQKRLTVAERRLAAADSGPIDILLNLLSGRKKMLERELATEKKELAMEALNGILNEDEIASKYKIPIDQVTAFLFYVIEDPRIIEAVKSGNDARVDLLMIDLATPFLALKTEADTPVTQPSPVNED
ncbi:MAG: hypothetical protein V4581_02950 [Bacteroidota bacterium]